MKNKIVCVIPARLASMRFPKKMLAPLGGKPLIQWAYEGAINCKRFNEVVIATDAREIAQLAGQFGARALMTDSNCQSGTDRLIKLQSEGIISGDIWVNWQGDEPFIGQEAIDDLLQSTDVEDQIIWTLKKELEDPEQIQSKNVVKVVTDHMGKALYFSRNPIPSKGAVYKHVGLYAFRSKALKAIGELSSCPLEKAERLEQLRFLYHGLSIHVHETRQEIFGIDTKEELAKAEAMCYTSS